LRLSLTVNCANCLIASVEMLETKTCWSIVSASSSSQASRGPLLTMSYRDELHVVLAPIALKNSRSNEQGDSDYVVIELSYRPKSKPAESKSARPLSPVKSFILTMLRRHVKNKEPGPTTLKESLHSISKGWEIAYSLEEEIRLLEFNGVTKVTLTGSDTNALLRARCILIGANISLTASPPSPRRKSKPSSGPAASKPLQEQQQKQQTRLDIDFTLTIPESTSASSRSLDPEINIIVNKIYGFTGDSDDDENDRSKTKETHLNETQMQNVIHKAIETPPPVSDIGDTTYSNKLGHGMWSRAIEALIERVFWTK
jgi:kinetochore protein Spc7/SPC105